MLGITANRIVFYVGIFGIALNLFIQLVNAHNNVQCLIIKFTDDSCQRNRLSACAMPT